MSRSTLQNIGIYIILSEFAYPKDKRTVYFPRPNVYFRTGAVFAYRSLGKWTEEMFKT